MKMYRDIKNISQAKDKLKELNISFDFYQSKSKDSSIFYFYDDNNKEVANYAEPTDTLTIVKLKTVIESKFEKYLTESKEELVLYL